MNRTPVYALSTYEYANARREAEALRRQEIARLFAATSERLRRARTMLAAVVRRTLERIRGAREFTFFGAS